MRLPLAVLGVSLACLLAACEAGTVVAPELAAGGGGAGGGGAVGDGGTAAALSFEEEVVPLLDAECASCHTDEVDGPAFMAGPDVYQTIMDWPGLVVPGEPARSTLLTKGAHSGPAWRPADARVISEWITQELGATPAGDGGIDNPPDDPPPGAVMTSAIPVNSGRHEIDLSEIGLPGARLTFYATRVATGLSLTEIAITAGLMSIRIVHPRFVKWVGGSPVRDEDRFSGLDLSVPAEGTLSLSSGAVLLTDFPDPGALSVEFASVSRL